MADDKAAVSAAEEEKTEATVQEHEPAVAPVVTPSVEQTQSAEKTYLPEALAACRQFRDRCDVLLAVLQSDVADTKTEAEAAIAAFMNKEVS